MKINEELKKGIHVIELDITEILKAGGYLYLHDISVGKNLINVLYGIKLYIIIK
ncbi:hypothetical protein AB2T96_02110 [Clostridium butyricum]|uniref:hypothetical protein n=1 Tax=Clostridium butyricum TaxID=1492 RepID=UPI00223B62E5|nr:hypothetical protein [Clostridium butyricum]MDU5721833.1 hypothetical protein [Clostridium butyricum]MDU5820015.1 hypothetical protein [Clostridium butyricum]